MRRSRVIMVTSCKGGVGKSTITANLGFALSEKGNRCLLLDCDFGMRCLDLIMGLSERVVYDICDVTKHGIALDRALVFDPRSDGLMLLAAPYNPENGITADDLCTLCDEATEALGLDYIIIDTPGGMGSSMLMAAKAADTAIIVTTHQPAAIHAAERTNMLLAEKGVRERKLIINLFEPRAVSKGLSPGIITTIDRSGIQLVGVVPKDPLISRSQADGALIDEFDKSDCVRAFHNIADRIEGKSVPLFDGFRKINRNIIQK